MEGRLTIEWPSAGDTLHCAAHGVWTRPLGEDVDKPRANPESLRLSEVHPPSLLPTGLPEHSLAGRRAHCALRSRADCSGCAFAISYRLGEHV